MRRSKALAATLGFLVNSVTFQLIKAKPPESLVEQSSKSDLQLLVVLNPTEEFVKDVLDDFRSQLADGIFTSHEDILKHANAPVTNIRRLQT